MRQALDASCLPAAPGAFNGRGPTLQLRREAPEAEGGGAGVRHQAFPGKKRGVHPHLREVTQAGRHLDPRFAEMKVTSRSPPGVGARRDARRHRRGREGVSTLWRISAPSKRPGARRGANHRRGGEGRAGDDLRYPDLPAQGQHDQGRSVSTSWSEKSPVAMLCTSTAPHHNVRSTPGPMTPWCSGPVQAIRMRSFQPLIRSSGFLPAMRCHQRGTKRHSRPPGFLANPPNRKAAQLRRPRRRVFFATSKLVTSLRPPLGTTYKLLNCCMQPTP